MNRKIISYFAGVVVIHIEGRKVERFLSYLYKLKIDILKINYVDRQNIVIKVFHHDVDKVIKVKTSYKIEIVGYEGKLRLKEDFKKHLFLLLSILIGYLFLLFLSNVIFAVEVIHSNANLRNLIIDELAERNIEKWHFKQNYKGIERIKGEILSEYKDRIEWLEIENVGTKYIVKVEERKIKESLPDYKYQDIVSTKNAIITKIEAVEGEIIKHKNDYVKKGDILISGRIMKGEELSKLVKADGEIYGEVWYNIKVEHPLIYHSKIKTGKEKKAYRLIFLNYSISLFDPHSFKEKISESSNIISNPLIPFKIIKEHQHEIAIEDEIYTDGEALIKAEDLAIKKMKESLLDDEYIISSRKLKYYIEEQKLHLEMFFKTYENIGEPRVIIE